MENYVCKYGLWHDKPVKDGEPSSNNGWIYTAYALELGYFLPAIMLYRNLYESCRKNSGVFITNRLPEKTEPPISHDEIIGMDCLMTGVNYDIARNNYHMCLMVFEIIGKYTYWDSIKALWKIRKQHRNYMWKNKVYAAYKLGFRLQPHNVYYLKKRRGKKTSFLEWAFFQLYAFFTIIKPSNKTGNISSKNILWLQLRKLNSLFWIQFINQPKNFELYFGKHHPFVKGQK